MNTNPRCHRCGGMTYGSTQWCAVHGDQADTGPQVRGIPIAGPGTQLTASTQCPRCGDSFVRLSRHLQYCVVQGALV